MAAATASGRGCSSTSRGVDPSTTFLGRPARCRSRSRRWRAHGLAHPDAESATARAAAAAGIPFILSTMSSARWRRSRPRPRARTRWFQLYAQVDPGRTRELVERAAAAGYGAIVLTVDLPVLGYRERDRRSGFSLAGPTATSRTGRRRTRRRRPDDGTRDPGVRPDREA